MAPKRNDDSYLDQQEACKSIFVEWRWLAVTVIGVIGIVGVVAVAYGKNISHIDSITAEEAQQRVQADSSLSYRVTSLEKRMAQVPSDLDTIKSMLRTR